MAKSIANTTMGSMTELPAWMNIRTLRVIIFMFGFLLYANTLSYDFTQDDAIVIYDNMYTTQGIKGIPGILEYDTFYGFFKEAGKANLVAGGRYRPFSLIVFAVLYEFFGNNPFGFHLFTVLLFSITCVVLFNVLNRLFSRRFKSSQALINAFISAVLFTGHPIHTEAVANIKGVDEILALLGSLLTLCFLIKYKEAKKLKDVLAAITVFLLALLSKENAITFLAVIPLCFFVFYDEKPSTGIYRIWPLILSVAIFFMLRTKAIGLAFGNEPMELMNNPFLKLSGNQYIAFTTGEKFATILFTLGLYVKLLFIPHPLTHDYYPRHIDIMSFGDIGVILSGLIYLAMLVFVFKKIKEHNLYAFGILYYLITISIVTNIVFPIGTNMSERFLFMPSVGFCIFAGYGIHQLASRFFNKNPKSLNYNAALAITGIICLLYSFKTFTRNTVWKDNYTLFITDVLTSVNSAKLQNSAGGELIAKAGKTKGTAEKTRLINEAIGHLEKAISIHPTYHNAYLLLGNAYFLSEKYDEAIKQYDKCLALYPNNKDALTNLHLAYREAGKYFGEKKGDLKTALEYLNKAYELNPQDYDTNRLLGVANGISGQHQKALEYFVRAAEINPVSEAFNNLSHAYYNAGDKVNGDKYAALASKGQESK